MANPMFGGICSRCGKEFDCYEPSTMCMGCVIERAMNRAKALPVREKLKTERKRK